jgi:hypothetical protein
LVVSKGQRLTNAAGSTGDENQGLHRSLSDCLHLSKDDAFKVV